MNAYEETVFVDGVANSLRLADFRMQRDRLVSICHLQQAFIDSLLDDISRLEEGKAVDLKENRYLEND